MKVNIVSSVETVTPAIATAWLEKNSHNRPVSDRTVGEYARYMRDGEWELNGEAIVFDETDTLADGQHRLWACIEAGKSFKTVVTRGVSKNAFATIDTGKKRSAADVLHIAGIHTDRNTLAAAAAIIIKYNAGDSFNNAMTPSRQAVLEFVQKCPELAEWVAQAKKSKAWTNAYASNIAAVAFLGANSYPQKAEQFVAAFISGENLSAGSPVLTLRNRLGADKRMGKRIRLAIIVLAWNAFSANRSLTKAQPPHGDAFPRIAGAAK